MAQTTKELNALKGRVTRVCGTIQRELDLRGNSLKSEIKESLTQTLDYFQTQRETIDNLQKNVLTHE